MKKNKKRSPARSLSQRVAGATGHLVSGMSALAGAVHPLSGPAAAKAAPRDGAAEARSPEAPKPAGKSRKRLRAPAALRLKIRRRR